MFCSYQKYLLVTMAWLWTLLRLCAFETVQQCQEDCELVDSIKLPLKYVESFRTALEYLLENGLSIYIDTFLVPLIGDWLKKSPTLSRCQTVNIVKLQNHCSNRVPVI